MFSFSFSLHQSSSEEVGFRQNIHSSWWYFC